MVALLSDMSRAPACHHERKAGYAWELVRLMPGVLWVMLLTVVPAPCSAQAIPQAVAQDVDEQLTVTATSPMEQFRHSRAPIALSLSRPLRPGDGALAFLAGNADVTALATVNGRTVTIDFGWFALTSGESRLKVFRTLDGTWTLLSDFPLRVARPGGIEKADVTPSIEINSAGLLADGTSERAAQRAERRQEVAMNASFQTAIERPGLSLQSQSSVVGADRDERALRFAERGADAPRVDLSAYQLAFAFPHSRLEVGHLSVGNNRQLISSFSSRGLALTAGPSWARLTVASVAGAPIVGWDNLLGVGESRHRMNSATITIDANRKRPGAFQFRVSALDGSLLPRAGFTQGAVVDAEESRGAGVEVSASTPGQRARLVAGLSRSTFGLTNNDPELTDSLNVARLSPDRRNARFIEGSLGLLNGVRLLNRIPSRLTVTVRHERVDPLYRSVGAFVQADRQQEAVELSGQFDVVTWQASLLNGRNNLAALQSVLTSRTQGSSSAVNIDLAALFRISGRRALLPQLSVSRQLSHEFALGAPASNDFRPQDLADQANSSSEIQAQWQLGGWRTVLRDNHTRQDNRQPDRERADFNGSTQTLTVERAFGAALNAGIDLGAEQQRNKELAQVTRLRRLGTTANWRPWSTGALSSNVAATTTRSPSSSSDVTNLEVRVELAQRVRLFGRDAKARTAQMFLRFARTTVTTVPFDQLVSESVAPVSGTQMRWSLNSGLSIKAW